MSRWLAAAAVCWALAVPGTVGAQPTDLYACAISGSATCFDIGGGIISTDCPAFFELFYGRVAWYPLRCVGPITVSVQTAADWTTHFPLFVEVVPYTDPTQVCENAPGYVVLIAYGGFFQHCGIWESIGPIDITGVVPLGSLYALRLRFFGQGGPGGASPGVRCVRLEAQPAGTSALSWSLAKQLYK